MYVNAVNANQLWFESLNVLNIKKVMSKCMYVKAVVTFCTKYDALNFMYVDVVNPNMVGKP